MLEAFIGYNSGDHENDEQETEKSPHVYVGSDHPDADRAYYVCSSETAAENHCRFSSRSENEQDRTEALHS